MTVAEAAASGDIAQLRALLEGGGDPNEAETEEHVTPLLEAIQADHLEAVRLLLDAGADMVKVSQGGTSPLQAATDHGSRGILRLLLERGYQLDPTRENVPWMLTSAAGHGRTEIVQWLLDQGVAVDLTDESGCTALTYAAQADHLDIVEMLLRAGADPNHRDNDTETILMWAADHSGNAAVLRALLDAGADVNALNDTQNTALTWTLWHPDHGDPEMIQVLLDAGATIQPGDLSRAVYNGLLDAVRLLVVHGADARDETNLDVAKNRGHREVANLLRQAMADQNLRDTGASYPIPLYPFGCHVRTRTGPRREGWIILAEWNHKHSRYGYTIEVQGTTQPRTTVSKRYWEDDLEIVGSERSPVTEP